MIQIDSSARAELVEASLYYAKISIDLAEKFLKDYEQTLSLIESMPLAWATCYIDFRKLNFKTFPYSIVYRYSQTDNEAMVVAIQNQSREPFYWKHRK
jgi:hypothetical protein